MFHNRKAINNNDISFPYKNQIVLNNLASAHFSYKDYAKSSALFKKLFDLDPGDVTTLETYAKAVSLAGRPHESRDLYNKAVKLAESSKDHELVKKVGLTHFL